MIISLAYIPVLHEGYLQFLTRQPIDLLLLLSPEVIPKEIPYLKKDLRAVAPEQMQIMIEALQIVGQVELATESVLQELARTEAAFVLPDEDISQAVVSGFLTEAQQAGRVTFSPIFLRWDKKTATEEKMPNTEQEVTADDLQQKWFVQAYAEAGKSSDWWRHVGAVVVKDGTPVLAAHNMHLPSEQQPYVDGDARALFSAGEWIELTSAIHAEAGLIAHAARAGISLEGSELYVTTFPCPPCAKLIAHSGIKKLYFAEGYAMFDGETILKDAGVAVVKVALNQNTKNLGDARSTVVAYPSTSSQS